MRGWAPACCALLGAVTGSGHRALGAAQSPLAAGSCSHITHAPNASKQVYRLSQLSTALVSPQCAVYRPLRGCRACTARSVRGKRGPTPAMLSKSICSRSFARGCCRACALQARPAHAAAAAPPWPPLPLHAAWGPRTGQHKAHGGAWRHLSGRARWKQPTAAAEGHQGPPSTQPSRLDWSGYPTTATGRVRTAAPGDPQARHNTRIAAYRRCRSMALAELP